MTAPTPREAADTCPACGSDDPMVTLGGGCENAWHYGADPDDDAAPDPCPQCGTELEDHLWLDLESCVRKLARATTPGDDRGRELAEALRRAALDLDQLADDAHADEDEESTRTLLNAASAVRAARRAVARLAAPAETEARDEDLDRWLGEQIEHARRGAARAEVRGWINTADTQEARRDAFREVRARLAATPPAPEGEAGPRVLVVDATEARALPRGSQVAQVRAYTDRPVPGTRVVEIGHNHHAITSGCFYRVLHRAPAPAGPQAEGAGETAGPEELITGADAARLPFWSVVQWEHDRSDGGLRRHLSTGWEPPLAPSSRYRVVLHGGQPPAPSGAGNEAVSGGGS